MAIVVVLLLVRRWWVTWAAHVLTLVGTRSPQSLTSCSGRRRGGADTRLRARWAPARARGRLAQVSPPGLAAHFILQPFVVRLTDLSHGAQADACGLPCVRCHRLHWWWLGKHLDAKV